MLEIELEYQRHARKLYLYNYIFRHRKPSLDGREKGKIYETRTGTNSSERKSNWQSGLIIISLSTLDACSNFNRKINILFVIKRVQAYQRNSHSHLTMSFDA